MRSFLLQLSVFTCFFAVTGCGALRLGSSGLNDPRPSGLPIAIASFSGGSVSGAASIFETAAEVYILRLEGLSVPAQSGLQVKVTATGCTSLHNLKGTSGNQNYGFSGSCGTFSNVQILSGATVISTAVF